jgi:muconolactone delta-isomerase
MAKYMMLWEVDTSRTPEDPKAKKNQQLGFQELVTKQLKEGILKEWGLFAGEWCGYVIFEGSAVELQTAVSMWVPFVKFKTREVMTIDEVIKATKALPE